MGDDKTNGMINWCIFDESGSDENTLNRIYSLLTIDKRQKYSKKDIQYWSLDKIEKEKFIESICGKNTWLRLYLMLKVFVLILCPLFSLVVVSGMKEFTLLWVL